MSIIEFSSDNDNNRSNIQIYSDSFSEDMGRGGGPMIEGRSEHNFNRFKNHNRRIHIEEMDERYTRHMVVISCGLCEDVLIDPIESLNCVTPFCRKCIQGWHQKNPSKCPRLCTYKFRYRNMHRIVKKILSRVRFHCPEDSCRYSKRRKTN